MSETAAEELERYKRENTIMRGILAQSPAIPCVYCGAESMAKCPRGFPGCGQADDLMLADDELGDRLTAHIVKLTNALKVARQYVRADIGDSLSEVEADQKMIDELLPKP